MHVNLSSCRRPTIRKSRFGRLHPGCRSRTCRLHPKCRPRTCRLHLSEWVANNEARANKKKTNISVEQPQLPTVTSGQSLCVGRTILWPQQYQQVINIYSLTRISSRISEKSFSMFLCTILYACIQQLQIYSSILCSNPKLVRARKQ